MTRLSACYFCGTALDEPLTDYPIATDAAPGDATSVTVTLCETCEEKLDRVLDVVESAPSATTDSGRADDQGETRTDDVGASPGETGHPHDDSDSDQLTDPLAAETGATDDLVDPDDDVDSGPEQTTPPTDDPLASSTSEPADADGATADGGATADDGRTAETDPSPTETTTTSAVGDASTGEDSPGYEAPGHDASSTDESSHETPAHEASSNETPTPDTSSNETPTPETSSNETPTPETSSNETPGDEAQGETPDAGTTGDEPTGDSSDEPTADSTGEPAEKSTDDGDSAQRSVVEGQHSISALEYNKVMRLLQNREFPIDREEIVTVAANAYGLGRSECGKVIDVAIDRGLIEQADGQLRKPDDA